MSSRPRQGLTRMSTREPTTATNLDPASDTDPLPWKRARDLLDGGALREGAAAFLGTVRPDGRPHSARIGAAWYDREHAGLDLGESRRGGDAGGGGTLGVGHRFSRSCGGSPPLHWPRDLLTTRTPSGCVTREARYHPACRRRRPLGR